MDYKCDSNIGQATITEAELWAFKDATHVSLLRGDSCIWFESDSSIAVNFVIHGVPFNHPCFRNDIARFERVHISHILREGNAVVDGLAGMGHSFPLGLISSWPIPLLLFLF
ncbi:Ribonuclease H-like superfamily [Sesbania bispinosa]|nr:Ribonuclease H-like superfamily [Sesbania bispinosa]